MFKNENEMLNKVENADETYLNEILPIKMEYNLEDIKKYGYWRDIGLCFKTAFGVLGKKNVN